MKTELAERPKHRALSTASIGAIAIGAAAFGAVAIGALAIGRLRVRRARIESLTIGHLTVDRLTIREANPPMEAPKSSKDVADRVREYNLHQMQRSRNRRTAALLCCGAAAVLGACHHSAIRLPDPATPGAAVVAAFEVDPNAGYPALQGTKFGGVIARSCTTRPTTSSSA